MKRITAIPLVVAAILVAGVFVSSSVHAGGGPGLDIGAAPAVITATSPTGKTHTFTLRNKFGGVFVVGCLLSNFESTTQGKSLTEITATPVFLECKEGFSEATVTMNGCKYKLKWTAALQATVDITGCTAGKVMEITFGACQVKIPEQNGLSHVTFQNVAGATPHINDKFTLSKVAYEQVGTCPGANGEKRTDGLFEGTTTGKAFKYDKEVQVEIKGHKFQQYVDVNTSQYELKST